MCVCTHFCLQPQGIHGTPPQNSSMGFSVDPKLGLPHYGAEIRKPSLSRRHYFHKKTSLRRPSPSSSWTWEHLCSVWGSQWKAKDFVPWCHQGCKEKSICLWLTAFYFILLVFGVKELWISSRLWWHLKYFICRQFSDKCTATRSTNILLNPAL